MAKKNKRNEGYLSIQKKLIAAVAMLLVASFMVASSSYAWFTLSTAPEVTGIKTNVGANGSLEIALYTGSDEIKTNVGDSTLPNPQDKNKTWGNQIDLSDASYGLDKIMLYPARLNVGEGNLLGTAPLYTPVYGSDGRVASLDKNTSAATYDGSSFSGIGEYGVKAIGSSSTMTDQQLDFKNAFNSIDANLRTAKMYAQDSLTADTGNKTDKGEVITTGSVLATIMADYATGAKTEFDITAMGLVLNELNDAQVALENAAKQWYLAALAVEMADYIDDAGIVKYEVAKELVEETSLDELGEGSLEVDDTTINFTVPTTIANYTTQYNEIATAISSAKTAYDALNGSTTAVDGDTMLSIVSPLVNNNNITISGVALDEIIEDGEVNADAVATLVAAMTSGGLELQLPAGSGVYADIAELVGELNASIKMSFTYDGIPLENVNCRMATKVSTADDTAPIDTYALAFPADTDADPSDDVSENIEKKLTDFYGYMIDLAFRTNADASNLMLQTTPVNRIYSSGGVEETLGSGSSMTFTTTNASFSTDNMTALMGNIRIAFVSSDNTIIAMGGLDTANATVNGTEVTAYIYLYSQFAFTSDGRLVKSVTTNDEDEIQIEELTVADLNTDDTKTALKSLAKNAVEKLSVLVYLDGDSVQNGDVANAAESMSGTMNLQFSSDADLKPMDYSPLQGDGSGNTDDDDTPSDTFKAVTGITGVPEAGTVGTEVDLTSAVVAPTDATNSTIVWSITDAGTTGVTEITDGKFTPTTAGTIKVTATIANGATESTPYTQEFTITIS